MGFVFRGLWHLTLFLTLLGVLGGAALISAFAHAAGPALGQGAYGTKTFVGGVSDGWAQSDAYDKALQEAQANQAAKEKAARDKKAKAEAKANAK
jgi:hypothetical protein